ncbi:helix-turn-helix domain-containing protein [Nocardia thailandica]
MARYGEILGTDVVDRLVWVVTELEQVSRLVTTVHARAKESESVRDWHEAFHAQMLSTGALSVHDVAIRLGYAESASFIHAFKRWKGVTPKQFQMAATSATAAMPPASPHG